MALTQQYARDAAIYEYAYATGTGPYTMAGAVGGFLPFSESQYASGGTVVYQATDDSANMELVKGTYSPPSGLSRDTILDSTNGGAAINWSGRTRVLIHLLDEGLPLCPTLPTAGQFLVWDEAEQEWCPKTIFCATPPTDGQVLEWNAAEQNWCPANLSEIAGFCATVVNVDSGTAYTATQADLQVVWNSTTAGNKITTIPGAADLIDGKSIDGCIIAIKTTPGDGSRHCIVPEDGTIEGAAMVAFIDHECSLILRANAAKSRWQIVNFDCVQVITATTPSGTLSIGPQASNRTVVEKALPIPPYGQPQVVSNTGSVTITTTQPAYLVLVVVSSLAHSLAGAPTVSGVSAAGVTFTKQYSVTGTSLSGFYGSWDGEMEIWGAPAFSPVTELEVDVTHNANFQSATYSLFAVYGVDLSDPWDADGFFSATGNLSPIGVSGVSTSSAPDMVFLWVANFTNPVIENDVFANFSLRNSWITASPGILLYAEVNAAILVAGSNLLGDWNYGGGVSAVAGNPLSSVSFVGNIGSINAAIAVVGALRGASAGGGGSCDTTPLLTCDCEGPAATGTVVANISGGSAVPVAVPLNAVLDSQFGSQTGTLIQGSGAWAALPPGTPGQVLTAQGSGQLLKWSTPSSATVDPVEMALAAGASMDWGRLGDVVSGTSDFGRIGSTNDPVTFQDSLGRLSD